MDSKTVFTKTAKGLMEATGKTSVLPRDLRALLKEIDGKATVGEVQTRLDRMSEAKLLEILNTLATSDYIREFTRTSQSPQHPAADEMNLDFTTAIPTASPQGKKAGEAARQQAKANAEAKAMAAAAEAAARARTEVEAKAKAEALEKAKAAAAAEAAARARAEAAARAKRDAEEQARRAAEERARKEAEARAQAEAQARIEAEARARKDAEEHARVEAELKARLEEERRAREEAERKAKAEAERERREAEEKAQREADALRAKLEEERQAREEAERKAKAEAERERREAEEKAQREADALRARLEEERKAKAEAERERREAEEKARREADELRAKLEQERRAREEAERKAKAETERERKEAEDKAQQEAAALRARMDAERQAREDAERKAKEQAERKAKEQAEREAREAEERARKEQQELARREAEARAREESDERSRREAEERAKREAEAQARNEAAENARREAAEQARSQAVPGSGASLEDLVKIETDFDAVLDRGGGAAQVAANAPAGTDDKLLQEAEAKTRRQAEELARAKAEDEARRAAESKAERDAQERRRKDEEEQRRKHAEVGGLADPAALEREHTEAQARIQAEHEETERHFAEMEKELEAEAAAATHENRPAEPAWDARKHVHAEATIEEAPVVYRTPIKWGKPVALVLFLILVLALVLVHFISFDGYIPQFEKLAGAHLQQPVKIKSLRLSLVPLPHWRLEGVSVGAEGQLAAARINAVTELGSMFSEQKAFRSIELESPVLSEQGLLALLFGKPQGQAFKVTSVTVKGGKLNSKTFILPALDAKIAFGENGAWKKIALETPDHKTSLLLAPKDEAVQVEVETNAFTMPFGPAFILENFVAKGEIGREELRLSEFKGGMYGGYLSGSANLKWGAGWTLGGEISARAIEPGRIAPTLVEDGKLEGKAVYSMRAKSYDELFAAPRLDGTFAVLKGSLLGVDLARLLQGGGVGGKTAFAEVSGSFIREGGRTQLRQVRLVAGPVSASGSAEADAAKNINGRFAVDLKSPVVQARASLVLSGTLREPHFNR